jgi:hypothetical protein
MPLLGIKSQSPGWPVYTSILEQRKCKHEPHNVTTGPPSLFSFYITSILNIKVENKKTGTFQTINRSCATYSGQSYLQCLDLCWTADIVLLQKFYESRYPIPVSNHLNCLPSLPFYETANKEKTQLSELLNKASRCLQNDVLCIFKDKIYICMSSHKLHTCSRPFLGLW